MAARENIWVRMQPAHREAVAGAGQRRRLRGGGRARLAGPRAAAVLPLRALRRGRRRGILLLLLLLLRLLQGLRPVLQTQKPPP